MNTAVFTLLVLGTIIVVCAIVAFLMRPRTGPSRRERQLELLVDDLKEIAMDNRDVGGNLSYLITDRIKEHERKELT